MARKKRTSKKQKKDVGGAGGSVQGGDEGQAAVEGPVVESVVPAQALVSAAEPARLPPLLCLPNELLRDIIERVSAFWREKSLQRLLMTCRRIHLAGLPVAFRKVQFGRYGAERMKALIGDAIGIDKTPFIRSVTIERSLAFSDGEWVENLEKCLANATHVELVPGGIKVLEVVWNLLLKAPMLTSLRLELKDFAIRTLVASAQFPANVRKLDLRLKGRSSGSFYRMLEDLPFRFDSLELSDGYSVIQGQHHTEFPKLVSQITTFFGSFETFTKYAGLDLGSLRRAYVYCWLSQDLKPSRDEMRQAFSRCTALQSLELVEFNTSCLIGLKTSLPSLRSLHLDRVTLDLQRDADFAALKAEFDDPELKIVIGRVTEYTSACLPEKTAWQSLENVRWIGPIQSTGMSWFG